MTIVNSFSKVASLFFVACTLTLVSSDSAKCQYIGDCKYELDHFARLYKRTTATVDKADKYSDDFLAGRELIYCRYLCEAALSASKATMAAESYLSCERRNNASPKIMRGAVTIADEMFSFGTGLEYGAAKHCGCSVKNR